MEPIRDLERRLADWQEAGLITADQAVKILEREVRPAPPRAKSSALSEILGYLGGSLALIAALVLVGQYWDRFGVTVRLGIVGGTTVLVAAAAFVIARQANPAILRLSDFLFVLATVGLAFFVALFCGEVLEISDRAVVVWAASAAAIASVSLWWLRQSPIRHVAVFVSLAVTALSSLALLDGIEAEYLGFALWALGLAWGLLADADVLPPRAVGLGLAAVGVLIGSQMFAGGEGNEPGTVLALATVAGLIGAGVFLNSALVLGIGTLGVFITVPRVMFTYFGEAAGGAVALLITGLLLLGVAVGVNKLGRRVIQAARDGGEHEGKRRRLPASRRTLLIVAAIGVVVLVFGYVVLIGYTPPPDYDSIPAGAPVPGTIAFLRWEGEENCVFTIPAAGGVEREVVCDPDFGGPVLWTPDGDLAVLTWDKEPTVTVFDAETGAVLATDEGFDAERRMYETAESRIRRADAAVLGSSAQDGRDLRDGISTIEIRRAGQPLVTVLRVTGPRSYGFWELQWSPDGEWVLATDSVSRTIVISADGAVGPYLLLKEASAPAWFIPGNATYTLAVPD